MRDIASWLPVASLLVAALAVFVGPWISWKVAQRQTKITLGVANKQIVAPIRQAWIDQLRGRVAEVLTTVFWYYVAGQDPEGIDEDESEAAGTRVERHVRYLLQEIELMLDMTLEDHRALYAELQAAVSSSFPGGGAHVDFPRHHQRAVALCQQVLQHEWNRINANIEPN